MVIIEAFVIGLGVFAFGLAIIVGCGIALSPIAAFLFWKYPHLKESTRSMLYGGWVYKERTEEDLKKFSEWAGITDTTPPTSP